MQKAHLGSIHGEGSQACHISRKMNDDYGTKHGANDDRDDDYVAFMKDDDDEDGLPVFEGVVGPTTLKEGALLF